MRPQTSKKLASKKPSVEKPPRRLVGAPHSLQRRLLLAAGAFVGVALVAAGLSIGFILQRFVRGQIDGRLDDRILSLVSDLRPEPGRDLALGRGRVEGTRDGPPFDRPRSGWYWQIRRGDAVLRSASLEERDLPAVAVAPAARHRDEATPVPADGIGPWGDSLILRVLAVPDPGNGPPTLYVASAPAAALRGPVLEALRTLAACLGLIGVFLFGGVLFQIRLGLRPLIRLRDQLADVRAGGLERLPERQPAEVRPLVFEMNALLDQNAANLEHARAHVANLAHGLKTPLATLSMAIAGPGSDRVALTQLVDGIDRRIRHHLRRARSAAVSGPSRSRAELAAHVADLTMTLRRVHADKAFDITNDVPVGLTVACDPQDLDEMLGNLTENACKWCRAHVRVGAGREGATIVVRVEEDGPGLDETARSAVLLRGRRLDESQPGYGFGLPIAVELAELYGGSVALETSELGGLLVRLTLPA